MRKLPFIPVESINRRRPGNYMGCQFRAFADRLLGVLGGVGDGREFRQ